MCGLSTHSPGTLCGECQDGYGVTFDLRFCQDDCGAGGIAFFVVICEFHLTSPSSHPTLLLCYTPSPPTHPLLCLTCFTLTLTSSHTFPYPLSTCIITLSPPSTGVLTIILSLLILYFDFPLPDELKGVIFFAQVKPRTPHCYPRSLFTPSPPHFTQLSFSSP